MEILELLSMSLSVLGAYLMSRDTVKHPFTIKLSFYAYFFSNFFVIYLAIFSDMAPMMIQYLIMLVLSILGIFSFEHSSKERYLIYTLTITNAIAFIYLAAEVESFKWGYSSVEILAASLAILGATILRARRPEVRVFAFGLFISADCLYIGIMLEEKLYFMTFMFIYFLWTSIRGVRNTIPLFAK